MDPSKNASNSYIVSLTADGLHCTYREVVLMQQTYIFIQSHPSHREEESCHTTTDESSLKSTIIVLHMYVAKPVLLYHVYVNEYHVHGNILLWWLQFDQIPSHCVSVACKGFRFIRSAVYPLGILV